MPSRRGSPHRHPRIRVDRVDSVAELLRRVEQDTKDWEHYGSFRPWFRGQADAGEPPLPSVLRHKYDQVRMTLTFRNRAGAFGASLHRDELAEWLFLAQHYGVPTRLLDWTESPLLACLFAVEKTLHADSTRKYRSPDMGIWLLHPIQLNTESIGMKDFPSTSVPGPVLENFKFAFGTAGETHEPTELPVAIQTRFLDIRMAGQQSCFTVHGYDRRDFEQLFANSALMKEGYLRKYCIPRQLATTLLSELDRLGISFSTAYPDLKGLATQLSVRFTGRPRRPLRPPFQRPLRRNTKKTDTAKG